MKSRVNSVHSIFGFLVLTPLALLSLPGNCSPKKATPQCSIAVISRTKNKDVPVCNLDAVRRLAQGGHVYEQNQLGIASVLAISPDLDTQTAVEWFTKSAERDYAPAQVNLGVLYANGWGVPRNYAQALYWFNRAAAQHYARSYYNLGILFLEGTGVRRDYEQALRYFRLGAASGDTSAQTNLGYMYDQGLGIAQDPKAAVEWYEKAAQQGEALAENNLADMYLRGVGVTQDDVAAFHWFQLAAQQGSSAASIKLGYMLAEGRGCQKDVEAGYQWVLAGTLAGDHRGEELLHSLASELTREQRDRAEKVAQEMRRKPDIQLSATLQP